MTVQFKYKAGRPDVPKQAIFSSRRMSKIYLNKLRKRRKLLNFNPIPNVTDERRRWILNIFPTLKLL